MQLTPFDGDSAAWDAYVSASPCGHYMQSHGWGAAQREAAGWEPHYLVLRDGATIRGAALLLARALPVLGTRVYYCPRGPVVDPADAEAYQAMATGLRAYLKRTRGVFVRADPYLVEEPASDAVIARSGFRTVPRDWSYWNGPRFVLWLDLQADEETIFKGMTRNCRNDVKAAYKKGVEFGRGTEADMDDFYRLMVGMGLTKGVAVHDAEYYRRLYRTLNRSCDVELFLGRYEGVVIAVGMSVRYGDKAWLLYAASDRKYYHLRANRTLQWEMIKWAHAAGCRRYDFRGTATLDPPKQTDPGYGVYEFKKSFGPEFVRLTPYRDLVANELLYRAFRFGEEKVLPEVYRAKLWLDEKRAGKSGATPAAAPEPPAPEPAPESAAKA